MKNFSIAAKRFAALALIPLLVSACASAPESIPTISEHLTAGIFLDDPALHHQLQALAPPPTLAKEGVELTEKSEGWKAERYEDIAHFCTIGYGHLIKKSKCDGTGPENPEFLQPLNLKRGEDILRRDMWTAQRTVAAMVKPQLNEYQFAALTDFVFNVGSNHFRTSTLLTVLNAGKFDEVGDQLKRWTRAGGRPVQGLIDRRFSETDLFYLGTKHQLRVVAPLPPIDIQLGEHAALDQIKQAQDSY
jgi:lysozyme